MGSNPASPTTLRLLVLQFRIADHENSDDNTSNRVHGYSDTSGAWKFPATRQVWRGGAQRVALGYDTPVLRAGPDRNDLVSKKEAGADGLLTVYLSGFRIREREDRDEGATREMVLNLTESVKQFAVGQPVELTRMEHMGAILSLCLFISSAVQSADRFLAATESAPAGGA